MNTNNDWSNAKIKFELEERGLSLAEVSRRAGYSETAAGRALRKPWPAVEEEIARAIGVDPEMIWPSRYQDGVPVTYLPRRRARTGRKGEGSQ